MLPSLWRPVPISAATDYAGHCFCSLLCRADLSVFVCTYVCIRMQERVLAQDGDVHDTDTDDSESKGDADTNVTVRPDSADTAHATIAAAFTTTAAAAAAAGEQTTDAFHEHPQPQQQPQHRLQQQRTLNELLVRTVQGSSATTDAAQAADRALFAAIDEQNPPLPYVSFFGSCLILVK